MEELFAETAYFVSFTVPFMWMSFALPAIAGAISAPTALSIWRLSSFTLVTVVITWTEASLQTDLLLDFSETLWHRIVAGLFAIALLAALVNTATGTRSIPLLVAASVLANIVIASDTGLAIAGSTAGGSLKLMIYLAISGILVGMITLILGALVRLLPILAYLLFLLAALIAAISVGLVPRLGELYYLVFSAI